jgi:hypothetical protein
MEAQWRVGDPVYGCAGIIHQLQEEIQAAQCELARTRAQLDMAAAAQMQQQQQQQASVPLAPPPPRSPQGAGDHHNVAAAQNQEEAPFLDPADEFLDLGRF